MMMIFIWQRSQATRKGTSPSMLAARMRALNESGVGKIRNFRLTIRRISETLRDKTKVAINQ